MTQNTSRAALAQQTQTYAALDDLLAGLFSEVLTEERAEELATLPLDALEETLHSERAWCEGAQATVVFCAEASPESLSRAKADFHRLFVGPEKLLAAPWGSVYMDRRGMLFGPSEQRVKTFMTSCGFAKTSDEHEPWDHFALELAFLSQLMSQTAVALAEEDSENGQDSGPLSTVPESLKSAKEFATNFVLPWQDDFLGRVQQKAETSFYRGLAQFARGAVEEQVCWLEETYGVLAGNN